MKLPSLIEGTLEVDHDRGVVYFHSNDGYTALRICRLPKPIPSSEEYYQVMLDITHMHGCNWRNKDV